MLAARKRRLQTQLGELVRDARLPVFRDSTAQLTELSGAELTHHSSMFY